MVWIVHVYRSVPNKHTDVLGVFKPNGSVIILYLLFWAVDD